MVHLLVGLTALGLLYFLHNMVSARKKVQAVHKEIDEVHLDQDVAKAKQVLKKEKGKLTKMEERI